MIPDILITNATLLPKPCTRETIDNGFVALHDGLIVGFGSMDDLPYTKADKKIDAQDCLVMPGFVNAHCHAAMTLFRGLADDLELGAWLNEHIFPAEATHVNTEMVYWCSKLAAAEMLLSGTTLVADGYFFETDAARAFCEAGIRSVAAQGIIDFPAPGVPDAAKNIIAAADYIDEWQDKNPLVIPAVFAHSPYTCSPQTLVKAKKLASERNVPMFIHIAETAGEQAMIIDPQGDSPVKHLDALGVLDPQTVCVHCIWVDDEDLHILAQRQAKVVICPQSHMKLASGHAPLEEILAKDIDIGLGTDGAASNNGLDLFREMDICAKLQKVQTSDPVSGKAGDILRLATVSGANALGFDGQIGKIDKGYLADLIVVDLDRPHLQPFYGPDILVYGAGGKDVRDVIVGGKMVVENKCLLTFDLDETMARVRNLAESLK